MLQLAPWKLLLIAVALLAIIATAVVSLQTHQVAADRAAVKMSADPSSVNTNDGKAY